MTQTHLKFAFLCTSSLILSACTTTTTSPTAQLAVEAPAQAALPTQSEKLASPDQNQKLDPNEEICRRERLTGSRFKKRVCATRAEWQRMQEQGQIVTRDLQIEHGRFRQP